MLRGTSSGGSVGRPGPLVGAILAVLRLRTGTCRRASRLGTAPRVARTRLGPLRLSGFACRTLCACTTPPLAACESLLVLT